jgi:hypothetical protein
MQVKVSQFLITTAGAEIFRDQSSYFCILFRASHIVRGWQIRAAEIAARFSLCSLRLCGEKKSLVAFTR